MENKIVIEVSNYEFFTLASELADEESYSFDLQISDKQFDVSLEFFAYNIVDIQDNLLIIKECQNYNFFQWKNATQRNELNHVGLMLSNFLLNFSIFDLYKNGRLALIRELVDDYDKDSEYDYTHEKLVSLTITIKLLELPPIVPILSEALF